MRPHRMSGVQPSLPTDRVILSEGVADAAVEEPAVSSGVETQGPPTTGSSFWTRLYRVQNLRICLRSCLCSPLPLSFSAEGATYTSLGRGPRGGPVRSAPVAPGNRPQPTGAGPQPPPKPQLHPPRATTNALRASRSTGGFTCRIPHL